MSSIPLVHPDATLTVSIFQAIVKCTLFENNPALTISPYRVESPVSLSTFQSFVSALKGDTLKITHANFAELSHLSEEFGFTELIAKLKEFTQPSQSSLPPEITETFTRIGSSFLNESFLFIVNGSVIESNLPEAAALSSAVQEQLSVDGYARKFFIKDSEIEASDIHSLQLLLSGESISIGESQGLLSRLLGNVGLERLFLDSLKADVWMNQSDLMVGSRIDLESTDLSFEVLDSLLLNDFVTVESEDSLLRFIVNRGSGYRDLLRHIQIGFFIEYVVSLMDEHFGIPPE
jgi:hypothetical protein